MGKGLFQRAIITRKSRGSLEQGIDSCNELGLRSQIGPQPSIPEAGHAMCGPLKGAVAEVDQAPRPVVAIAHTVATAGRVTIEQREQARQIAANFIEVAVLNHSESQICRIISDLIPSCLMMCTNSKATISLGGKNFSLESNLSTVWGMYAKLPNISSVGNF